LSAASLATSAAPWPDGTVGVDVDKQQLFGIRVAAVEKTSGSEKIRVLGRVVPEETRVYRITAGSDGLSGDLQRLGR